MKALVVFESMYGNTRHLADAIAVGIGRDAQIVVRNVNKVTPRDCDGVDLVVVGGPTHVHGMSRPSTRRAAEDAATASLLFERNSGDIGVREWTAHLAASGLLYAAFGTRMNKPKWITGSAAAQVSSVLRRQGHDEVVTAEDFVVGSDTRLVEGEVERAERWGAGLAESAVAMLDRRAR